MDASLSRWLAAQARAFSRTACPRRPFRILDRSRSRLRELPRSAEATPAERIRGPPPRTAGQSASETTPGRMVAATGPANPRTSVLPSQRSRKRTRRSDPLQYLAVRPYGNAVRALQTVPKPGERPVITVISVLIAIFLGAVTGCVITMAVAAAAINHWTEWMMRKVRYWQAEATRARQESLQPESSCETPGGRR
jgi:hypothetical protein